VLATWPFPLENIHAAGVPVLLRAASLIPDRVWFGLVRPGFIFIPDCQAQLFTHLMGLLNQVFLGVVSGSVTITLPRLRLRTT